jgi:uncharacterized protein YpmB
MSRKKIIISVILVAIIGGAWYGYKEYTRKVKDLSKVKAQVKMHATDLITAFEKDEAVANAQYLDKIIAVKGMIKAIEKDNRGYYAVVIGEEKACHLFVAAWILFTRMKWLHYLPALLLL